MLAHGEPLRGGLVREGPARGAGAVAAARSGEAVATAAVELVGITKFFGPVVAVTALTKRLHTRAEVEDVTMTLLEFAAGHLGYVGSAWACPGVFFVHVYGTRANYFYQVNFRYWEQSHLLDEHSRLERQTYGEMERVAVQPAPIDMLREQLEEWAACIREGGRPEVGAREALEALAVVWAALRSAREGRRVELREVLGWASSP